MMTWGEVMHPNMIRRLSPALLGKVLDEPPKHADYLRYVRGVYNSLALGEGKSLLSQESTFVEGADLQAVGFKLMYTQLPQSGPGAPVGDRGMMRNVTLKGLLKYAALSKVVVIHLHRLNHLERLISLESIKASNLTYHDNGAPTRYSFGGAPPKKQKVTLNITSALMFARVQLRQNRHLQQFLDTYCTKFGAECHTVAYENLLSENLAPKYFAALRAAVGLKKCQPAKPKVDRGAWVPCAERVQNWDEVESSRHLRSSLWLHMCKNENKIPKWLMDMTPESSSSRDGELLPDANLLRLDPAAFERGAMMANDKRRRPPQTPTAPPPPPSQRLIFRRRPRGDAFPSRRKVSGRAARRPGGSLFVEPTPQASRKKKPN